jgi:hypothetical protein
MCQYGVDMKRQGKAIFVISSLIITAGVRQLLCLVQQNIPNLSTHKFGIFLAYFFSFTLVSVAIWGIAYIFYLLIKKAKDVWFFASAVWLMFLCCPLLFLYTSALLFPNTIIPIGLGIILLSGIIGALPLSGVNAHRRWLLGTLTGFCGFLYSFIIGWFYVLTVKERHAYVSVDDLMIITLIAVIFGIGGMIGGIIADQIYTKRAVR